MKKISALTKKRVSGPNLQHDKMWERAKVRKVRKSKILCFSQPPMEIVRVLST